MNKIYLTLLVLVLALGLVLAVGGSGQGVMSGQDDDSNQTDDDFDSEDDFDDDSNETDDESEDEVEIEDDDDKGKKIRIRDSEAHSELNITEDMFQNRTRLKVHLSNGFNSEIKIMPDTASERALEVLRAKCGERNCSIELKEVASNNGTRAAYEVQAEKEARVLGLFKTRMRVEAEIDAETGEVIQTKKPWWAFLAKED